MSEQVETWLISIHALHEESDLHGLDDKQCRKLFQSTLSMRRATKFFSFSVRIDRISIHALHEESDLVLGLPQLLR